MMTRPLTGVRVLDLTRVWAGPLATQVLADFGAEVIKVEPPLAAVPQGEDAPGRRGPYFNQYNRNKLGVIIDLAQARGRELLLRLAASADVVAENFTPRVMPNLGLSYDALASANPRIVMLSMPGLGLTGPQRDYVTWGVNIEGLSGIGALTGYEDEGPLTGGMSYGDPVAGLHAALAVLMALEWREATGRGCHIDLSQLESLIPFLGEALLACQMGADLRPMGNRHPMMAPHGVYRCGGDDEWIAIAVRTDEEWIRLCQALGEQEWCADAGLRTADGRLGRQREIETRLEKHTRARGSVELERKLLTAGVPAQRLNRVGDLFQDPQLRARGAFVRVEANGEGFFPFRGIPLRLSASPGRIARPAPLPGEHSDYVFGELLGMSPGERAELERAGIISEAASAS